MRGKGINHRAMLASAREEFYYCTFSTTFSLTMESCCLASACLLEIPLGTGCVRLTGIRSSVCVRNMTMTNENTMICRL